MASLDAARDAFLCAMDTVGEFVLAYELVPRVAFDLIAAEFPHVDLPDMGDAPWFLLVEMATASPHVDIGAILEHHSGDLLEKGLATTGIVAGSEAQRLHLWQLREAMVQAQTRHGSTVKHDISVSLSLVPELIHQAGAAVATLRPDAFVMAFGHLGDGNIHFNVSLHGHEPDFVAGMGPRINALVYETVEALKGSISAEHGIGALRRKALLGNRAAADVETMRRIKEALDPGWTLNPDSIFLRQD
jgi:FAD/FMN-containing dehydrogenase